MSSYLVYLHIHDPDQSPRVPPKPGLNKSSHEEDLVDGHHLAGSTLVGSGCHQMRCCSFGKTWGSILEIWRKWFTTGSFKLGTGRNSDLCWENDRRLILVLVKGSESVPDHLQANFTMEKMVSGVSNSIGFWNTSKFVGLRPEGLTIIFAINDMAAGLVNNIQQSSQE